MERLPGILQSEICKYLTAADLVNLCEAMPSIKQVLESATFKRILRNYVSQMDWLDTTLYRMLSSTLTNARVELETELLFKTVRYYIQDSRSHANYLNQDLPNQRKPIHFLVLGSAMSNTPIAACFLNTLHDWTDERGRCLRKNRFIHNGLTRIVASISTFDIYVDIYTVMLENEEYLEEFYQTSTIHQYDCVVYVMNSTAQCRIWRRLPYGLNCIMTNITTNASNPTLRSPVLLILDTKLEQREEATASSGHFDCLLRNLRRLDDGRFPGSPLSATASHRWRVWCLHHQGEMFVNMYEAFRWAVLEIAATTTGSSRHHQSMQSNSVSSHSSAQ
ncbi:Cyclin F box [Echinococcus multilocularis]|uniref:Cyclin F box n=1 Tax=Echinococcus multilocularis TaxID=6211 RepID=A0A068Y3W9_ECHMU|nr:Cyclin F box [Echinococcus multilocularis]